MQHETNMMPWKTARSTLMLIFTNTSKQERELFFNLNSVHETSNNLCQKAPCSSEYFCSIILQYTTRVPLVTVGDGQRVSQDPPIKIKSVAAFC